jgi:hypothetical protein
VSPVIAELLLIVITVAIGTLVYSFASTAFGGFGSGFSNLVLGAGQQLSENLGIEQVFFYNNMANNSMNVNPLVGCAPYSGPGGHCGGIIYVRNVGVNPITITNIYLGNVTSPGDAAITTDSTHATCSSSTLAPNTVCFAITDPTHPYQNAFNSSASSGIKVPPGQSVAIHVIMPDSSPSCAVLTPQFCVVAFGGTTYAFTIVTARGNNFVAYESA